MFKSQAYSLKSASAICITSLVDKNIRNTYEYASHVEDRTWVLQHHQTKNVARTNVPYMSDKLKLKHAAN